MPNTQIPERVWTIFTRPTPPQRKEYKANLPKIPEKDRVEIFSAFNEAHMKRVGDILEKWNNMMGTGQHDEEARLNKVLDDFESMRGKENPDLLYFALEVFLTHYNGQIQIEIPSLLVREPELTAPSGKKDSAHIQKNFGFEIAKGSDEETKLDWFREDPLLNEHHGHWHVVYNRQQFYDRQGEMFLYMHQQMLARYDAERQSEDVNKVVPFSDMRNQIRVGYTAGPDERLSSEYGRDREVNVLVSNADANTQLQFRQRIINDINNAVYDQRMQIADPLKRETDAINRLGSTLESNQQALNAPYRNYHGNGHGYIGNLNGGVMLSTVVAIRDVVFWEWHKEVDLHYARLQERFSPYNFTADAPPVTLRKGSDANGQPDSMDIILCNSTAIPGFGKPGFDGAAIGNAAFGKTNWNKEFLPGNYSFKDNDGQTKQIQTTNTLVTRPFTGTVRYNIDGDNQQYDFKYVNHDPFCYFIRVQNNSPQQRSVTVRIFIVPDGFREDRRSWIEMDKFLWELMPNSSTVIFRSDEDSSVIRKPAIKNPSQYAVNYDPVRDPQNSKCKCGWPYHLLLPKGKRSQTGAPYKIVVMLSDARTDMTAKEAACGSLSFCAATNNLYPDKRPLGYPFNRRFGTAIMNAVTSLPNFACKSIFIQHVKP